MQNYLVRLQKKRTFAIPIHDKALWLEELERWVSG